MLTIEEVAEKAGLTRATAYQRLRKQNIRTFKKNRIVYYYYSAIELARKPKNVKIIPPHTIAEKIMILQYYQMHNIRNAKRLSEELSVSYNLCKELVKEYDKSGCVVIESKL